MLEINFIRENKEIVEQAIKNRKSEEVDLEMLLSLDDKRRELLQEVEDINRRKKEVADSRNIEEGKKLKEEGTKKEAELRELTKKTLDLLGKIPNIPSADTPIGPDDSANVVERNWGEKTKFSFTPKPHYELGKKLNIIDEEKASKVVGSRFAYLKGDLVLLQFAIINFALKVVTNKEELKKIIDKFNLNVPDKPFIPVLTPCMIKPEMLYAMGRLEPKEDKFFIEKDNLFLAGSSEHTMGPIHSNETIKEKELPIRYVGYSTCFRREAGSYGKDTRGILRQHQFDKMEMESFTTPEKAIEEQDFLVAIQEYIMQELKLPYQVLKVCTGDMGAPDQRQIDIEVWIPSEDKYRESHSSDYVGGYQARRLGIKVERENGKKEIVHMNDATLIALGRLIIAIIENYQQEDGSIVIPDVLKNFVGKDKIESI